eukprot:7043156-Pyramimonas_sp.AAC.1
MIFAAASAEFDWQLRFGVSSGATLPASSLTAPSTMALVACSVSVLTLCLPVSSRCANDLMPAIARGEAAFEGHGKT